MFNELKKFIKKKLYSKRYFDVLPIYSLQIYILNKIDKTKNSIFKIKKISDLKPFKKLDQGYKYISKTQNNIEITVPDLNLYVIKDAKINSRSSAIISGKNIFYEAINDNERFNEGFITYHSKKHALINLYHSDSIEEGFFLAGNGSFNWYHWLIEILPKALYYTADFPKTILVDESVKIYGTMLESMNLILEKFDINIYYLDPKKTYNVGKLYFVNEVNKMIYNVQKIQETFEPLYYFRKNTLIKLSQIMKKHSNSFENSSAKIYLERINTHRIAQNHDEVKKFLKTQGFIEINVGSLTLQDQINTFSNADEILGVSGAAWTNILFSKKGCKAVIFMPNNFKEYKFYEEIALLLDIKFTYFYYENNNQGHSDNNFKINIESLKKIITK